MKDHNTDVYSEELFSVSKPGDYLKIKQLLHSQDIEFREKTVTSSICCAEPKAWIENKTTFLIKKTDLYKARSLCEDIIGNIKKREHKIHIEGQSFFKKLIKMLKIK